MQENLIGFLLGALDGAEQDDVSRQLENDPQLRQQLEAIESRIAPLETQRWQFDPPEGLAAATCERVLGHAGAGPEPAGQLDPMCDPLGAQGSDLQNVGVRGVVPRSRAVPMTPVAEVAGNSSSWSLNDLVIAAGIFLAAGSLFLPILARSNYQARLAACKDNLRELGRASNSFSEIHRGYFPQIPEDGPRAAAGVFGASLWDSKLITEPSRFVCPGSELADAQDSFQVTEQASLLAATGRTLVELRSRLGGSYGYHVGHRADNGQLQPTRNLGRTNFALMSDAPQLDAPRISNNHGGKGQNVLFEGGNVHFVTGCRLGDCDSGDDFFLNDDGAAEAGNHRDDSVILASQQRPVRGLRQLLDPRQLLDSRQGAECPTIP